jgi:type II secretion system protein H
VKTPTSSTGRSGFTLVELVAVMAIVAVLATMIVPRLGGTMAGAQLREQARGMLWMARYARETAATRRRECRLVVDPEHGSFRLEMEEDPQDHPGEFVPLAGALVGRRQLSGGVSFGTVRIEAETEEGPANTIRFHPDGRADAAVVEITDGRRTFSLLVAPGSGRLLLVDGTVPSLPTERQDLDA